MMFLLGHSHCFLVPCVLMRVAAIGNMGIAMWSLLDIHFNFMGSLSLVHVLESGTPPLAFSWRNHPQKQCGMFTIL